MNEVFIAVPQDVTLKEMRQILARTWTLDPALVQPSVQLGPGDWAYIAEVDDTTQDDPLFLAPEERAALREQIGEYRLFAVRYASPELGRDMARAIASSELAERPMLVDLDDTFVTPAVFLQQSDLA